RRSGADGTRLLRCAGAVRDGGPRPAGGDAVMERRTVGAGLAGGLVAGAAVGAAEALAVWLHAHGAGEVPAFGWALAAYGLIGAAGGLGLGILAAILGTDGFALAFAVVGFGLAGIVGRFRVIRDVFLEQMPSGIVPLAMQAAAALLLLGVAAGVWRALAGASARRRAATRPGIAAVIVGVLALLGAAAARLVPAPAPVAPAARAAAPGGAPNVLLIMVDTLRADHLSCYGYGERTPHIDALASGGVRFANTFSQASWTRPSVATILTGLYPASHGAVHKADILPDRVDTLAEMLARGGYHTVGFAENLNRSEEHTSELQSRFDLVCRLLLEKKKTTRASMTTPMPGCPTSSSIMQRDHIFLPRCSVNLSMKVWSTLLVCAAA